MTKDSTPLDRLVQAASANTPDSAFLRVLANVAATRTAAIAALRRQGFNDEKIGEALAVARAELSAMVETHEAGVRKAHETAIADAKAKYITEHSTPERVQEASLLRDRVSAASDHSLRLMSKADGMSSTQLLVLGGECRRRGMREEADLLALKSRPSDDPWMDDPAVDAAAEQASVWTRARTASKARMAAGLPNAEPRQMVPVEGGHVAVDDLLSGASDEA